MLRNKNIFGHKITDEWMLKQAIWFNRDMIYSCLAGFIVGVIIGLAACI